MAWGNLDESDSKKPAEAWITGWYMEISVAHIRKTSTTISVAVSESSPPSTTCLKHSGINGFCAISSPRPHRVLTAPEEEQKTTASGFFWGRQIQVTKQKNMLMIGKNKNGDESQKSSRLHLFADITCFLECKNMIQKLNWNQASCGNVQKYGCLMHLYRYNFVCI